MAASDPIRVNRAPVLTLWAAVVAERLGHPPDTALSVASAVAGTAAHAKAKRLGLAEDRTPRSGEGMREALVPRPTARLFGREVPLVDVDGVTLAEGRNGTPALAGPVLSYLQRAFGVRLADARAAMETLASKLPNEELNRVGFRLYEAFRPEVPEGTKGWGAKGELDLNRIFELATREG